MKCLAALVFTLRYAKPNLKNWWSQSTQLQLCCGSYLRFSACLPIETISSFPAMLTALLPSLLPVFHTTYQPKRLFQLQNFVRGRIRAPNSLSFLFCEQAPRRHQKGLIPSILEVKGSVFPKSNRLLLSWFCHAIMKESFNNCREDLDLDCVETWGNILRNE